MTGLSLRDALTAGPADRGWTLRTPNVASRRLGDTAVYVSSVLAHDGAVEHWQWWAERRGQAAVLAGEPLAGATAGVLDAIADAERTLGVLYMAGSAR